MSVASVVDSDDMALQADLYRNRLRPPLAGLSAIGCAATQLVTNQASVTE